MKLKRAMEIINSKQGFMVSFEHPVQGGAQSDHFPDKHAGEELIQTEEEAWDLAKKFAEQSKGTYYNIYVIGNDFKPVKKGSNSFAFNKYACSI